MIIDIPEEMRTALEQGSFGAKYNMYDLAGCVVHGTPLPKGHDRLIFADDVKQNHKRWLGYLDEDMIGRLNIAIDKYVPTIIEVDRDSLEWLGKNCKDCGNEKCKELGILPKEYDCALWQAKQENNEDDAREQATLDEVLEDIHELEQENIGRDGSYEYESACKDFRAAVEAMKAVSK